MSPSAAWFGPFFAFLSSCTWAVGSASYSRMTRTFSPFQVNFTRGMVALPLFVAATFFAGRGWSGGIELFSAMGWRQLGWFTLSMIASYGLGDSLFLWSTISLGVPGALAIASSYPLIAALGQLVFEGAVWPPVRYAGLLLSVAGIVTVILSEKAAPPTDPEAEAEAPRVSPVFRRRGVGILLAFLTAGCWATNGLAVARGSVGIDLAAGSALRLLLAMILSSIFGGIALRRPVRPLPLPLIRRFAGIFLLEAFLGTYFYMYGVSHSELVVGITLTALAPVISVPVSVALGLERFSWTRTLGVVMTVGGILLLVRTPG